MAGDLSLGITESCHVTKRENMPLWRVVDLDRAVGFSYIKYKWVLFGFFFFFLIFKDVPVGRNHGKGQHLSRTIVEILEENSLSPLWSCKNFDYNGSLSVRTKAKGLCATLYR